MYCKHCGKELSDEAFMCPACGAPTGKPATQKSAAAPVKSAGVNLTGLSAVALFFAIVGFVTGIIFGAFFFVYPLSQLLLYILGTATILPSLAAVALGIYTLVDGKGGDNKSAKTMSIVAVVFAGVALLFLFLAGCIVTTIY